MWFRAICFRQAHGCFHPLLVQGDAGLAFGADKKEF